MKKKKEKMKKEEETYHYHISRLIENKVKYKRLDKRFLFTITLGKLLHTPDAPLT